MVYATREIFGISHICAQTSEVSREGGGLLEGSSHLFFPGSFERPFTPSAPYFRPFRHRRVEEVAKEEHGHGPGEPRHKARRGKAFQTRCVLSAFPRCRSSPAPSHFGKSSAHLGFPCLHPRKAQMKVLVAQPHHVSESSHSPCQRNNYAIKYLLFLFSSMIVCTCAVSRGLSPPGIRAFLFTPLPTVRNAPLTPPVATLRCYLATEEGAYTCHGSGYHPIGAQRSDTTFPTVRRDGCAGNSPFRRQKGEDIR
jgi:hypothetical protein